MEDNNPKVQNILRQEEEHMAEKYAAKLGLPYEDLTLWTPDPAAIESLEGEFITAHRIFPFRKKGSDVWLAVESPDDPKTLDALDTLKDSETKFTAVLVSRSSMEYLLSFYREHYANRPSTANTEMTSHTKPEELTLEQAGTLLAATPPVELLDKMVEAGGLLSASDIHLEPEKDTLRVRFRLDGELVDVAELSLEHTALIISRIKLLSGLKLNIKDVAQDGSFSTRVNETSYDIRVSVVPAQYGESAVLRLLPQTGKFLTLDQLGLEGRNLEVIQEIIKRPNGLILNTGPTGSGKTTTLYSILSLLNKPGIKIITLEDPIEYKMEGISQTEVNPKDGYSFADGLKAALRQDPDIILVGEIRDAETAKTAVQAALTGHLVLSTLHTNDAAGALPRLVELGVAPNLFSEAVAGIIAQRLVRTLNPAATADTAPWPEWAEQVYGSLPQKERQERLPALPAQMPVAGTAPTPYKGRTGIYETLVITPEIDKLIQNNASVRELREQAIKDGMVTMAQDGFIKIANGKTTLEEVQKTVILP